MKATPAIRRLPFRHNQRPDLGFEVFRLSELFGRAGKIGHDLEAPQRPEFHIVYVGLRGRGTLMVDFAPQPLGAGIVTVTAAGRVQHFVPERGVDAWMLMIAPEFVAPDARAIDPLRGARVLSPSWATPVVSLPAPDLRAVLGLTDAIVAEHARPAAAGQAAILGALVRAVLLMLERCAQRELAEPSPAAIERFLTILERDHARTREVGYYARAAGVSARRLAELTQRHRGRTPKQLVDERVVLEQKRLLAHTDVSVKELAARTGFAEPTNLIKFFRQRTGQTPLEFRAGLDARRAFLPSARRS
ncbi:MAG: helix-turn-helix domain-containing protein [Deltaproteobacteria bacterium]|nr:helix-turn-helix domain-containing protein [Deltaproteobacteria bacterium]